LSIEIKLREREMPIQSAPIRVVGFSAATRRPSRTTALVAAAIDAISRLVPVRHDIIDLADIGPSFGVARRRDELSGAAAEALTQIEAADILVVGSPIYRGTYTGAFKHIFDLADQTALANSTVVLTATGGSDRHTLALEHSFRPLFGFFGAQTVPVGIYAAEFDFDQYKLTNPDIAFRLATAAGHALRLARAVSPTLQSAAAE
jgi:FMN reductase